MAEDEREIRDGAILQKIFIRLFVTHNDSSIALHRQLRYIDPLSCEYLFLQLFLYNFSSRVSLFFPYRALLRTLLSKNLPTNTGKNRYRETALLITHDRQFGKNYYI